MNDEKTLASVRKHRNEITGTLLSDLEARETLEDGTRERLLQAAEKVSQYNDNIQSLLHNLCKECGWGVHTGYNLETLRQEAEQDFVLKDLVELFTKTANSDNNNTSSPNRKESGSVSSSSIVAVAGGGNSAARNLMSSASRIHHNSNNANSNNNIQQKSIVSNLVIPDVNPYVDLLSTLTKERVPDDVQPRVRKTVESTFFKPLFPEEYSEEPALQNLSKLLMSVSSIIIMAANEEDPMANRASALQQQQQSQALKKRRSGIRGSTWASGSMGGRMSTADWRNKRAAIENKIRELQSGGTVGNEGPDFHHQQHSAVAIGACDGSSNFATSATSNHNNSQSTSAVAGTGGGGGTLDPQQIAGKIEVLLDEELDVCESWFDATAKIASDFVLDSKRAEANEEAGKTKSTTSSAAAMFGGGMVLSTAQLIRTKDEIAEATQALFRLREDRLGALQDLKIDQEKVEEMMEEKNKEDLDARVAFKQASDKIQAQIDANVREQQASWNRLMKEFENISRLSANANELIREQVQTADRELERRQRYSETQQAKETQISIIEKLRLNFKSAIRLIDTTCDYLGTGQSKITTAKVGADLSNGLREAAASLHESFFEYASRICRRVNSYEKRIAAAALVQRNVDSTLVDLKSAKAIADEAGSLMRSLTTVRDMLQERLDLAYEKLERHLALHKSITDAESANHSSERPVQQRVRDLEVMMREDVIRTLSGHVIQESIFLDVARSRLEVATKLAKRHRGGDEDDQNENDDL